MTSEKLIWKAYKDFSIFKKPARCVRHDDDCPECRDHERLLKTIARENFSLEAIGTVAWSPVPNLNPEAMAYFLPKLIEFAVSNSHDREGDPFIIQFILYLTSGPGDEQFKLLGDPHVKTILDSLLYIQENYSQTVEIEGYHEELDAAISQWRDATAKKSS
jgi:hypothetical protein